MLYLTLAPYSCFCFFLFHSHNDSFVLIINISSYSSSNYESLHWWVSFEEEQAGLMSYYVSDKNRYSVSNTKLFFINYLPLNVKLRFIDSLKNQTVKFKLWVNGNLFHNKCIFVFGRYNKIFKKAGKVKSKSDRTKWRFFFVKNKITWFNQWEE